MQLVPNWRRMWRAFSVQAMTLALAIQGAWAGVPDELKANIPPKLVLWITVGLLVAGIVGRMVDQPKVEE